MRTHEEGKVLHRSHTLSYMKSMPRYVDWGTIYILVYGLLNLATTACARVFYFWHKAERSCWCSTQDVLHPADFHAAGIMMVAKRQFTTSNRIWKGRLMSRPLVCHTMQARAPHPPSHHICLIQVNSDWLQPSRPRHPEYSACAPSERSGCAATILVAGCNHKDGSQTR